MFSRISLAVVLATTVVSAQGVGNGAGITGGGNMVDPNATIGRAVSPMEQFIDKLKVDIKTQLPTVQQIVIDASTEARPIEQDMLVLRQKLVNTQMDKTADVKPLLDAYAADSAKVTTLEVTTFEKVCATLKPNQCAKSSEAFDLLPAIFAPAAPAGGRRGGGRGMGGMRGGGGR